MLVNLTSLCDCHDQAIIYHNVNPKFDKQRWVIHMLEPGKTLPPVTNPLVALVKMTTKHVMQQILAVCGTQSIVVICCCPDGEMLPCSTTVSICVTLNSVQNSRRSNMFCFFFQKENNIAVIYSLVFLSSNIIYSIEIAVWTHLLYLLIDVSFVLKDWLCATSQPNLILARHTLTLVMHPTHQIQMHKVPFGVVVQHKPSVQSSVIWSICSNQTFPESTESNWNDCYEKHCNTAVWVEWRMHRMILHGSKPWIIFI